MSSRADKIGAGGFVQMIKNSILKLITGYSLFAIVISLNSWGQGDSDPIIKVEQSKVATSEGIPNLVKVKMISTKSKNSKDSSKHSILESLEQTARQFDSNGDGRVDTWREFQRGQVNKISHDTNGDGKPDVFKEFSNDLEVVSEDENHDGEIEVKLSKFFHFDESTGKRKIYKIEKEKKINREFQTVSRKTYNADGSSQIEYFKNNKVTKVEHEVPRH